MFYVSQKTITNSSSGDRIFNKNCFNYIINNTHQYLLPSIQPRGSIRTKNSFYVFADDIFSTICLQCFEEHNYLLLL